MPLLLVGILAGCSSHAGQAARPQDPGEAAPVDANPGVPAILHLLGRATYGARPGDVEAVRAVGVTAYLERQLHPERIDDTALEARLAGLETISLPPDEIAAAYVRPANEERKRRAALTAAGETVPPLSASEALKRERRVTTDLEAQKILRAVYSERQLQEVLVDFWFNHFNVFAGKGADRLYVGAFERDTIRPRVLGRFRDLLGAVAESPAMLFYLDNWLSARPNPPRAGLNENYARELMELHTLGVDGGYTQVDVGEVARCFTGWTIAKPNDGGGFVFDPRRHDTGQKVVLGHVIKAGGGKSDGDAVLDILARHPATARFVAAKLARRFVGDDPPVGLVDRAAARFRETDGDLREVVRTILLSSEFRSRASYGAKVKSPLEFAASALRALDARVDDPAPVVNALRAFGMPLYGCLPPTGYADRAEAWATAGSLVARMSFATALASNRMAGVRVDLEALAGPADSAARRERLVAAILGPGASPSIETVLARHAAVPEIAALALGSPDFQRR